jgi:hypothetical protein
MLELELRKEREEKRRRSMMQVARPVLATDEYMYIRSLHQPRSRTIQLEQPEQDVTDWEDERSVRMNRDVGDARRVVEDKDVPGRCMRKGGEMSLWTDTLAPTVSMQTSVLLPREV